MIIYLEEKKAGKTTQLEEINHVELEDTKITGFVYDEFYKIECNIWTINFKNADKAEKEYKRIKEALEAKKGTLLVGLYEQQ